MRDTRVLNAIVHDRRARVIEKYKYEFGVVHHKGAAVLVMVRAHAMAGTDAPFIQVPLEEFPCEIVREYAKQDVRLPYTNDEHRDYLNGKYPSPPYSKGDALMETEFLKRSQGTRDPREARA